MLTSAAQGLGSRLKAERESRGFTLEHVAASTKIPVALLQALERGDLARWPKGLYRRAFFRTYLAAVGLPPEPLVGEFALLFPDEPASEASSVLVAAACPLTNSPNEPPALAIGPAEGHRVWRYVALASIEAAAVVATGGLVAWAAETALLMGIGAVALVYYPAMRAAAWLTQRSPNVSGDRIASTPSRSVTLSSACEPTEQVGSAIAASHAAQHIRSRAATAPTEVERLPAQLASNWRPLARQITKRTNQALWRATGRTRDGLRNASEATRRVSSAMIRSARVVLCRAGNAAAHASRQAATHTTRAGNAAAHASRQAATHTSRICSRAGSAAARASRQAATHTTRVGSHVGSAAAHASRQAATHTSRIGSRVGRAAARASRQAASHTSRVCSRVGSAAAHASRQAATHTTRVGSRVGSAAAWASRQAATHTSRIGSRVGRAAAHASRQAATHTSRIGSRVGRAAVRASRQVATHTIRVGSRSLGAANYGFWRSVRAVAEYVQVLAARQLKRTGE